MTTDYKPGKISTLFYTAADWDDLEIYASQDGQKSLTVQLATLSAGDCIASILAAMAKRALQIWPSWYGSEWFNDSPANSLDGRLQAFLAIFELCRRDRNIEPAWLKKAVQLVAAGKPPLVTGLIGEIQVRQLVLALTGNITSVTLLVSADIRKLQDGNGFPRAVEWLAREGGLEVTVLLPKEFAANEDLASLLYNAGDWRNHKIAEAPDLPVDAVPPPPAAVTQPISLPPPISEENAPEAERRIGVPHPKSRGEQLLAEQLLRDPQLAGLFGHNLPVNTRCGRKFLVDLLWQAGRVVVEIDGYYFHGNSIAFGNDRDRDYRLLISGYRVLRLTHDEVIRDVGLALEKIRDVVNFVQSSESEANNVG